MRYLKILILFIFSSIVFASDEDARLVEKVEQGVVKINIYQQGVMVSFGSGFFISSEGTFVTSLHVIENALSGPYTIEVVTKSGEKFKSVSLIQCGHPEMRIDVCLLKISFRPKFFFTVKPISLKKGSDILVLGHPRGYQYTLSTGIISGIQNEPAGKIGQVNADSKKLEFVQISAPISPGNSGGPVFSKKGDLVGISTWIRTDVGSQNLNFAISVNEIAKYFSANKKPIAITDFKRSNEAETKANAQKLKKRFIDPLFARLDKRDGLAGENNLELDKFSLKVKEKLVTFYVPQMFSRNYGKCSVVEKANSSELNCLANFLGAYLRVNLFSAKPGILLELPKLPVENPRPLPITADLISSGEWEKVQKTLTYNQKKYLFSVPNPWKCKRNGPSRHYFWNNSVSCDRMVFNDGGVGLSTYTSANQSVGDSFILESSITIENAFMASFYYPIPVFIIGSAILDQSKPF